MIFNTQIPTIVGALRVIVHPEQRQRLAVIDLEDYSGVARKVREHFAEIKIPLSEGHLIRGMFALKQYYAVAMLDPANAHAISRSLDPFWHAHILHTEQYMAFCQAVVGEYMHHYPLDHDRQDHVDSVRSLYGYTVEILPRLFSTVDSEFWPSAVSDAELICFHKGNQTTYTDLQPHRLFEPNPKAFAYTT